MESWETDLLSAARSAKFKFESTEAITNKAHAIVAIALLKAFDQENAGFILAEPRTPDRHASENGRPADLLILHPEVGALFIEVKGWSLRAITRVEGGTFFYEYRGREEAKDPYRQAQAAAQQLQNATRNVVRKRRLKITQVPFFDCIVAFPNIFRADWLQLGFGTTFHPSELLFIEDLEDPAALRIRLARQIKQKAGSRVPFTRGQLDHVREALGSSEIINSRSRRDLTAVSTCLATEIDRIELITKRLSIEQRELIESEFEGRPQLIRGVAGSGKTIVLVKNLVRLVDRLTNSGQLTLIKMGAPKRFAIVCFNRSLVPLLRKTLEEAYLELTHGDPPNTIDIYHMNGLHWALSRAGVLRYQPYSAYKRVPDEPRAMRIAENYCQQLDKLAVSSPERLDEIQYDAIYVDEGQDLFAQDYRFLMKLIRKDSKTGEKNIVIFYDDAQNLYGRPRPVWADLGVNIGGRTHIMKNCHRNTRQIIEFAFNLLLGTTAEARVTTRTFADVAYLKANNLVTELEDRWQVNFAQSDGELPRVKLFESRESEKDFIVYEVTRLLDQEHLLPSDILIIFEDFGSFHDIESRLRRRCSSISNVIKPFGPSANSQKDSFIFEEGSLTMSTVYAAKGYDRAVVFLIGVDAFPVSTKGRAAFYVAATRAKNILYVSGIRAPGSLALEAESLASLLASG